MTKTLSIGIFGNVEEKRTEAEIYYREDSKELHIAVAFEDETGWHLSIVNKTAATELKRELSEAFVRARERLQIYKNRRGENIPARLNAAGLSLWLLEKGGGSIPEKGVD